MINAAWPSRPLGDIATRMQYGISKRGEKSGRYPILRMNCLKEGTVSFRDLQYVDLDDGTARQFTLKAGDLLFNRTNSFELVGRTGAVEADADAVFASYMIRIAVDQEQVEPGFLNFFMNWERTQDDLKALATRAVGQANISAGKLRSFYIPVPEREEQRRIARTLSIIRTAIGRHQRSLDGAQELKRAAMRALFTQGLRGETQKDTEIGLVPESWEVLDFVNVRDWLQYGTSTHCTYEVTAHPVLRIPNIEPGYVRPADLKYAKLPKAEAERYVLQDGDLIFIRTNGVIERLGACAVYAGQPEGALFASYLIRARLKRDLVDPCYLAYFYASAVGTSIVAGRATPAADGKYNLNTGTIDSLPLPLPPTLDEQREIVAVLDAIDRKIDLHKRKRAALEELFRSLLHKLMTGEIRVAELDLSALEAAEPAGAAA